MEASAKYFSGYQPRVSSGDPGLDRDTIYFLTVVLFLLLTIRA